MLGGPGPDISLWHEGKSPQFATYQEGIDPDVPLIIISIDDIPFSVMQGKPPSAYNLYDTDGDGLLDFQTDELFVPLWVVLQNSRVIDAQKNDIKHIMDIFYEQFQSDMGPDKQTFRQAYIAFEPFHEDISVPNRDLMYLLYYYNEMVPYPTQALYAMKLLEELYSDRYQEFHPLISLFILESSINGSDPTTARDYVQKLLVQDPGSIPGQYYQYRLEENSELKQEMRTSLIESYPEHWLIIDIDE